MFVILGNNRKQNSRGADIVDLDIISMVGNFEAWLHC